MTIIKIITIYILFIPLLIISSILYILGGWTKGWNEMFNPLNEFIDWIIK